MNNVALKWLKLIFIQNWQVSFLNGLMKSKIIVLLISNEGIKGIKEAHKRQDNVLLEYEYALHRYIPTHSHSSCFSGALSTTPLYNIRDG